MEESLNESLTREIMNQFNLKGGDPCQLSPLVLAYIGDCVFDLIIKTYLIDTKGNVQVNKLNRYTSHIVKAETQAKLIEVMEPELTEQELAIYKRGRNAKSYTSAKNATIADYRKATGLEALVGWFYLSGKYKRMTELIKFALVELGEIR